MTRNNTLTTPQGREQLADSLETAREDVLRMSLAGMHAALNDPAIVLQPDLPADVLGATEDFERSRASLAPAAGLAAVVPLFPNAILNTPNTQASRPEAA